MFPDLMVLMSLGRRFHLCVLPLSIFLTVCGFMVIILCSFVRYDKMRPDQKLLSLDKYGTYVDVQGISQLLIIVLV